MKREPVAMVLIVTTLLAFAPSIGAQERSDAPEGIVLDDTTMLIVADPATLESVITVVEAMQGILSTLEGRDGTGIAEALASINGQLTLINSKLDLVLDMLARLEVLLNEEFDMLVRSPLTGQMLAIRTNYNGWSLELRPGNPRRQVTFEQIEAIRLDLERLAGSLMTRDSFANYHIVGYAMVHDHMLFTLLARPNAFRRPVFEEYASYYTRAANPEIPGSVGSRRRLLLSENEQLIARHEALRGRQLFTFNRDLGSRCFSGERCNVRIVNRITGSLQEGYRSIGEQPIESGCVCTRGCGCDRPVPSEDLAADISLEVDPFDFTVVNTALANADSSAGQEVNIAELNRDSERFRSNVVRLRALDEALQGLSILLAEANRLSQLGT